MAGVEQCTFLMVMFLGGLVLAANGQLLKSCTGSDFCSRHRSRTPAIDYNIDPKSLAYNNSSLSMVMVHKTKNLLLNLTIFAIEEDIFRVTIHEVNTTRYRLQGVLEKEPQLINVTQIPGRGATTQINGDFKVISYAKELMIEFYYKNNLAMVLNGNKKFAYDDEGEKQGVSFDVQFLGAKRMYGIPEHGETLALRTTKNGESEPYRLFNSEMALQGVELPTVVYGSVPIVYGHSENHTCGVFYHNAAKMWVDIKNRADGDGMEAYFVAESGYVDLFFLMGPTPKDTVIQYSTLTGVAPLPQLWTLGYHQSRWNYDNASDVKNVIAQLDRNDVPVDAIWLDIEYTDDKRYFTWDPVNFKDPKEMLANLSSTNRKLVATIDPHIKVDDNYGVYKGFKEQDYFVKLPDGSDFEGECWPGPSRYIDFFNPKAADYYASLFAYDKFKGTDPTLAGIWNDMNEPSVFDENLEMTLPANVVHHGGVAHRHVHNVYGLQQTKATYKGLMDRDSGKKRPFVFTRAHFAGTQRYAAVWTGYNRASWDSVKIGYQKCLNEALSGISFCGADVGGFINDPNPELLQRWYQAGIWLPFFRAHAGIDTKRREPYMFPEEVQNRIRSAIKQRYAHIPTWYTLFYEHYSTGEPIIRPLFYEYPSDPKAFDIDDQLLVGENILVKAVSEPSLKSVPVYFPGEQETIWYDIQNKVSYYGGEDINVNITLDAIPVYYKSGSIVVRKDTPRRNTHEMRADRYTLYIQLNDDGEADGTIYIDDMESFDYLDKKNAYLTLYYKEDEDNKALKVGVTDINAGYPTTDFAFEQLLIHKPSKRSLANWKEGEPIEFETEKLIVTADGVELRDLTLEDMKDKAIYF